MRAYVSIGLHSKAFMPLLSTLTQAKHTANKRTQRMHIQENKHLSLEEQKFISTLNEDLGK